MRNVAERSYGALRRVAMRNFHGTFFVNVKKTYVALPLRSVTLLAGNQAKSKDIR